MNTEMRIKELENEIATLKSESALQNRLASIKQKAEKRDLAHDEEISELIEEYISLREQISNLNDRIVNIFKVRKEILANGFTLEPRYNPTDTKINFSNINVEPYHELYINNRMWHGSRYITVRCNGNAISIYTEFNEKLQANFNHYNNQEKNHKQKVSCLNACLIAMRDFVKDFDDFETDFYNQVDNL